MIMIAIEVNNIINFPHKINIAISFCLAKQGSDASITNVFLAQTLSLNSVSLNPMSLNLTPFNPMSLNSISLNPISLNPMSDIAINT